MPKLTINSVCPKGSVYPIICNFQNGYPSEDFECECAVIQDNSGKKTIVAEIGGILYVGAEDNENIGQTLLVARNRKTGKVRLIETGRAELKPIIDLNDQEETQHQQHSNRIVKPVQYEESNTGIIQCETISNPSTPLNSSVSRHRCESTPSKKGSTTSFSRTHSGQFQHLSNFVVDEIRNPNDQSETVYNKSPKTTKVIETNIIEEFTVDVGAKKLNDVNKMTARELPRNMFEEDETGSENGAIVSENLNFTTEFGPEELQDSEIMANETLEDFSEEKGTDLEAGETSSTIDIRDLSILSSDSVNTSSEFEDENNFKSKVDQEKREENWEMEHENFSIKQYFVSVLGLDSKGEKQMKQNADVSTSNNSTHDRTKNNSISSNQTDYIYICDYCQAIFKNKELLISHLTSHEFVTDSNNGVIQSNIGNDRNRDLNENLNKFYKNGSSKRNSKVDTTTIKMLMNNEQIVTENTSSDYTYIYECCEAVFENGSELVNDTSNNVRHAQIKKNEGNEICIDFNEKSIELKAGKNKKINNETCTENNAFVNTYICDNCGAMFENKGQLISHLISHDFVNDTSNNVTHAQINKIEGYINEYEINTNFNEVSNKLKDEKYKKRKNNTLTENTAFETCICDYCEATYENKNQLISHLITHALVKHINNGTRSRIKRNIVNNENERNIDCNKISNEFKVGDNKKTENYTDDTVPKNVFAHNEIVTENISSDTTYICGFCEAMFKNKGTLISHITSHEKHLNKNTPEQKRTSIINIDNYTNENAGSIIKNADSEIETLSTTGSTIVIDDNNENETAYSKNYRNKIDGKRNPKLNETYNELKDNENGKRKNLMNDGLTATKNTYICDYCETVFEEKGSLIFHLISHKFTKDVDNITLRKLKILKGTDNESNENVNPSKQIKKQKGLNPDLNEISKAFKDKTRKRKNQVREQTATMNTYICDYCDVEFEDKGQLILHVTSHKLAKDTDNMRIIQSKITIIQENNDENNKNENNRTCSKNYGNSKKQKKRKPDINEESREFKDGFNKKVKYNLRTRTKLVNPDQGQQIGNSKAEMDTVEVTHDIATKLINCKHCTYKTDDTSNILKHILTHKQAKSEAIYICNDCGREFKNKAALIIHISRKNNSNETLRIRRHLCVTCNISFTSQANLINHQTELHPSAKPYKCTLCDNKYITKQGLTLHKQTHKAKPFRCPICKYQCHKSNFVKHMKSHKDSKSFECKYCDFKFNYISRLKQHMVIHSGKKDHKCTICNSEFSLLSDLNRHLLIHSKDKHFKCENCSAGFNDLSTFKRHQKTHTGEKSYKCTHCEYSCITGNELKRHLKTHDTKKRGNGEHSNSEHYQCTMCNSKFSSKYSLIRHMKIHTGEKTHKCTFCDKVFVHLTGLKRHLNVHSQNKPVICTACNTSYDNEKSLKAHLRRSKKHKLRVVH